MGMVNLMFWGDFFSQCTLNLIDWEGMVPACWYLGRSIFQNLVKPPLVCTCEWALYVWSYMSSGFWITAVVCGVKNSCRAEKIYNLKLFIQFCRGLLVYIVWKKSGVSFASGLVTNSILFCWLFKIKDRRKKVRFQQMHNQGLRQLLFTVSLDLRV